MDKINHPSYYADGNIEVIEFIEDKHFDFCLGSAIKYLSRAGKKSKETEITDLEKAIWYINRRIQELKEQQEEKKTYTAAEIGAMFGVSAERIDEIAIKNGLKTSEYGEYYNDQT